MNDTKVSKSKKTANKAVKNAKKPDANTIGKDFESKQPTITPRDKKSQVEFLKEQTKPKKSVVQYEKFENFKGAEEAGFLLTGKPFLINYKSIPYSIPENDARLANISPLLMKAKKGIEYPPICLNDGADGYPVGILNAGNCRIKAANQLEFGYIRAYFGAAETIDNSNHGKLESIQSWIALRLSGRPPQKTSANDTFIARINLFIDCFNHIQDKEKQLPLKIDYSNICQFAKILHKITPDCSQSAFSNLSRNKEKIQSLNKKYQLELLDNWKKLDYTINAFSELLKSSIDTAIAEGAAKPLPKAVNKPAKGAKGADTKPKAPTKAEIFNDKFNCFSVGTSSPGKLTCKTFAWNSYQAAEDKRKALRMLEPLLIGQLSILDKISFSGIDEDSFNRLKKLYKITELFALESASDID